MYSSNAPKTPSVKSSSRLTPKVSSELRSSRNRNLSNTPGSHMKQISSTIRSLSVIDQLTKRNFYTDLPKRSQALRTKVNIKRLDGLSSSNLPKRSVSQSSIITSNNELHNSSINTPLLNDKISPIYNAETPVMPSEIFRQCTDEQQLSIEEAMINRASLEQGLITRSSYSSGRSNRNSSKRTNFSNNFAVYPKEDSYSNLIDSDNITAEFSSLQKSFIEGNQSLSEQIQQSARNDQTLKQFKRLSLQAMSNDAPPITEPDIVPQIVLCSSSEKESIDYIETSSKNNIYKLDQKSNEIRMMDHSIKNLIPRSRNSLEKFDNTKVDPYESLYSTDRYRGPLSAPRYNAASVSRSRLQENTFENYENVTVDPSQYSREEVRRAAAAVVKRYLESKNFPGRFRISDIAKCSSRTTYQTILEFCCRQLGPMDAYECIKFESRIPKFYKDIGYPGNLAKSHMISPCTVSTWPQHLAALTWFVCLLNLDDIVLKNLSRIPNSEPELVISNSTQTPRAIGGLSSYEFSDLNTPHNASVEVAAYFSPRWQVSIDQNINEMGNSLSMAIKTLHAGYLMYRRSEGTIDQNSINSIVDCAVAQIRSKLEEYKQDVLFSYQQTLRKVEAERKILEDIDAKTNGIQAYLREQDYIDHSIQEGLQRKQEFVQNINALQEQCDIFTEQLKDFKHEEEKLQLIIAQQGISKEDVGNLLRKISLLETTLKFKQDKIESFNGNKQRYENLTKEIENAVHSCFGALCNSIEIICSIFKKKDATSQNMLFKNIPKLHLDFLNDEVIKDAVQNYLKTQPTLTVKDIQILNAMEHFQKLLSDIIIFPIPWFQWLENLNDSLENARKDDEIQKKNIIELKKKLKNTESSIQLKIKAIEEIKQSVSDTKRKITAIQGRTKDLQTVKAEIQKSVEGFKTLQMKSEDEALVHEYQKKIKDLKAEYETKKESFKAIKTAQNVKFVQWAEAFEKYIMNNYQNYKKFIYELQNISTILKQHLRISDIHSNDIDENLLPKLLQSNKINASVIDNKF